MIVRPVDVAGEPLQAETDIHLEAVGTGGTERKVAEDVPAGGRAEFDTKPTRTYLVRVAAEGYRTVAKLTSGTEDDLAVPMPIKPSAVTGYRWPEDPGPFPGLEFADVETDERRGALLNIWAKLAATWLGTAPAASFVEAILEVRDDRLICGMATGLLEALLDAAEADEATLDLVPSALHEPPDGYRHGPSYKTRDTYGNLQITTFLSETDGGQLKADVDIDEHRGALAHLFDVIEHHATGSKTGAVEVQQILIAHQGIDPGWQPLLG